ncbi:MAG TPA: D-2-hydroxyacid dehydrogenase [Chloroflexia bacterium]|nr:D-2-hydroxyacid dehydrogenase [Chloroflexia bacterium]
MTVRIFTNVRLEPELKAKLDKVIAGKDVTLSVLPEEQDKARREKMMLEQLAEAEIFWGGYLSPEQFSAAKALKWIQVTSAGVNHLLSYPEIINSDVTVTNSAGIMAPAIADQVLGYILTFSRQLSYMFKQQERKEWAHSFADKLPLIELAGRSVGIIGYGHIGMEIARRARAFGMKVIATKNNTEGNFPEVDTLLPSSDLDKLLKESDYVVMCAPLTPKTEGMLGRAEFEQMKSSAYFINIARGQLVKEPELIEVLREKRIAGAALDVFVQEPLPPESPFWEMENVLITPHSSGNFEHYLTRACELFAANLERYFDGKPLINLVDKKRGY